MARKKGKKKTHRHHRRVRGVDPKSVDIAITAVGAAIGAAAGWLGYTKIKGIPNMAMAGGQLAVGIMAALFIDQPLVKGIGFGLVANSGIILGESSGLLAGIGEVFNLPSTGNLKIAGYGNVKQIGDPYKQFPSPAAVGNVRRYAGGTMR